MITFIGDVHFLPTPILTPKIRLITHFLHTLKIWILTLPIAKARGFTSNYDNSFGLAEYKIKKLSFLITIVFW